MSSDSARISIPAFTYCLLYICPPPGMIDQSNAFVELRPVLKGFFSATRFVEIKKLRMPSARFFLLSPPFCNLDVRWSKVQDKSAQSWNQYIDRKEK